MLEVIEQINNIGIMTILNVVVLVIIGVPTVVNSWEKFKESLGIIQKKEIRDSEQERRLKKLEENFEKYQKQANHIDIKLTTNLEEISNVVNTIREELLGEKIERMRWRILDCANDIKNDRDKNVGIERVNYALKTYDDYERIIDENHLTNNQVEESIKYIKEYYQDLLHNRQDGR